MSLQLVIPWRVGLHQSPASASPTMGRSGGGRGYLTVAKISERRVCDSLTVSTEGFTPCSPRSQNRDLEPPAWNSCSIFRFGKPFLESFMHMRPYFFLSFWIFFVSAASWALAPSITKPSITKPSISKIDPPGWWASFPDPMLLVQGDGLEPCADNYRRHGCNAGPYTNI